jgi:hypothetical protein
MRELHGYHGEHRRHAHDATAPADTHEKHARDRAHEAPKHASHDSPKFKILWDPEARKAERLKYEQKVEAAEAEYAGKHAKPKPGDQPRTPDQRKPQESKPEHAPPETRERLSADRETQAALAEVDERTARLPDQAAKKQKPQRSWLPRADMVKAISDVGMLVTTIAVALGDASAKWDAVAAGAVTAVVSNIAWANRRWKEKHGDRSEG